MSLIFKESPVLISVVLASTVLSVCFNNTLLFALGVFLTVVLIYFYRCQLPKAPKVISDDIVIAPTEGKIINITEYANAYYIAIFMSVFDKHYQVYPANCLVVGRKYDKTGEFELVMNLNKSKNNEKKIHNLQLNNGGKIKLMQIAGFLPSAITSCDDLTHFNACEYLGMIKFGSRVDLIISKQSTDKTFKLSPKVKLNSPIKIGDLIGTYV